MMTPDNRMRNWRSLWLRFARNTAGNVAVMFALGSIPVFGAVGIAVDTMRANDAKSQLAAALDSAVLAGASADAGYAKAAEANFDTNFSSKWVTVTSRSFKARGKVTVEGEVAAEIATTLTKLLGLEKTELRLVAEAKATAGSSPCILAVSPSASQALLVNSGASVTGANCEIHVKSTGGTSAVFNAGTTIDTHKICLAGSSIIDNGGTHPNLEKSCATAEDPYKGNIPEPSSASCDYNNGNYSSATTLSPGVYCGWFNFNAGPKITLNPGVYVIKNGGWNVNGGEWSGSDVTFYYADSSKIQFNSAVKASLSAPVSGTYANILMAEKEGLSDSQFIFDDSLGFEMTGALYLPSREVVFNSGTTTRSHKLAAVVRTVIFNSTKWQIEPLNGSGAGKVVTLTK